MGLARKIRETFLPCKDNGYEARFLKGDFLFTFILTIFILRTAFLPFYLYLPGNLFFAEVISSDIVSLLNEQRMGEEITILSPNSKLNEAAALKAQDMLEKDYFAHESPDGVMAWDFIEQVGYEYSVAGENLAIGFLDSQEVHQAWNNSPLHKRNLLDPRFRDIGVAVTTGEFKGKETTVVVQIFAQPARTISYETAETAPAAPSPSTPTPSVPAETSQPPEAEASSPQELPAQEVEVEEPQIGTSVPGREGEIAMREQAAAQNEELGEELPQEDTGETEQIKEEKGSVSPAPTPEARTAFAGIKQEVSEFLIRDYDKVASRTVMGMGAIMGAVLLLNLIALLLAPIKRELKLASLRNIFLKGVTSLIVLLALGAIDKTFIIQLIPHTLRI